MISLEWSTLLGLFAAAVNVGYLLWANYYLKHNIPALWDELHKLKELYHNLDKHKLTREMHAGGKDE